MKQLEAKLMEPEAREPRARRTSIRAVETAPDRCDESDHESRGTRARRALNPPGHHEGDERRLRSAREASLGEKDATSTETIPVTARAASQVDLLGPDGMAELIEVFTVLDRWARELEDGK